MIISGGPGDIADGVGRSLDLVARQLNQAVRDLAKEAAKVAREEHRSTARAATGGDGAYSGLGNAGRLSIRVRYGDEGVAIIPKGTWKIAEEGADPHVIRPKKGKALKIAGQDWREGAVNHPGTARKQGKKAWSKAREATVKRWDKAVPEQVERAVDEAVRSA
jgi:hypothetical protein